MASTKTGSRQCLGFRGLMFRRPTRRTRYGMVVAGLSLLPTCALRAEQPTVLPPPVPEFPVTMREYGFDHAPQASAGRVMVRARNGGSLVHELILIRLPDDFPESIQAQLGTGPRAVATVVALYGREPGSDDLFAVDLLPGRYGFICFRVGDDGVRHLDKGMSSEFTVV